ncbi:uncharacterized protein LOC134528127 isoform X1 [Bacillus rossius redtenbacheri]|uniref:uncharacterized protein LOC134528127 isoform X1 n=1 Tax=Bacillus rossius redtenbacheri TaxID=93214 RepID=UPI002FDD0FFE
MTPRGRVGAALLLLVAVCMVRAYPQSLNQTPTGSGESGQNQRHYASDARTSSSNKNSGPTVVRPSQPVQEWPRNQRRQFPERGFTERSVSAIHRRFGVDEGPPAQQPPNHAHHSGLDKHSSRASPLQTSNKPLGNQGSAHRTQHRSIQSGSDVAGNNNDDQNGIIKLQATTTNHERNAHLKVAPPSVPEESRRAVDARRFHGELKMAPKGPLPSHTMGHTTGSAQGGNGTHVAEKFHHNSFDTPRTPARSPSGSEEGIVFPDQKLVVPLLGKDDPDCAKGLTYCENVNGYPNDQIVQLISKETSMYKSLFGTDVWMPEIANRISPDEELCKYNEQIVFPKVGKNKDEKWTWIANTPEFKQGVRVEECQNTNSECQLVSNWPIGYKTECKQKYILRRMLSVTGDGSPSADDFLFPSCCVCSVKKVEEK